MPIFVAQSNKMELLMLGETADQALRNTQEKLPHCPIWKTTFRWGPYSLDVPEVVMEVLLATGFFIQPVSDTVFSPDVN